MLAGMEPRQRHVLKPLLLAALLLAGPALGQSGSFPVFGPSAEREAFFAAQARAEADRVAALQARQHAAELARLDRDAARARQAEAEAEARLRRPAGHCVVVEVPPPPPTRQHRGGTPAAGRRLICPGSAVARPWPAPPPPDRTDLFLRFGDDGLTARGRILRPGLSLGFALD
jgi:hypothetical protein